MAEGKDCIGQEALYGARLEAEPGCDLHNRYIVEAVERECSSRLLIKGKECSDTLALPCGR
jgi:hypothetical protein